MQTEKTPMKYEMGSLKEGKKERLKEERKKKEKQKKKER